MYIKLTKIDHDADMGGYDAIEVTGKRLDDGKTWSKPFFANNNELINQLNDFSIGEEVNVMMEQNKKNKKFWNIVAFKEMTDADREKLANPQRGGGTTHSSKGSAGSDKMTKAEWAEKDRVKTIAIARAVALKAAVENLKEGAPAKAIMKRADELLPYLFEENHIQGGDSDSLDPPA